MIDNKPRKLTALIGCSDEWLCRSLQSVFEEKTYVTARATSGKKALQLARRGDFDVLMLDQRMEDLGGADICVALRDDPLFDHATPIVIISSAHATLQSRTEAYAAGAWEYCHLPLDVDGLFLKLGTFLRARRELAASQALSLMDPSSGLYTPFGLHHLAEQLEARALRNHEAFACLAFSPQPSESQKGTAEQQQSVLADLAQVVRAQARKSDVIGLTGDSRLAILAPNTDAAGARLLASRLQHEVDQASRNTTLPGSFRLRTGFCAVADLSTANVDVTELVHRAESALAHVPDGGTGDTILGFDELPVF